MWVVDRIEGDRVVLVADGPADAAVDVAIGDLPEGIEEGCVLRVPDVEDHRGETIPDWSRAVVDPKETTRRRKAAAAQRARLRKRDPGGDVVL
ncbi:MAG: DUF3006 family protein [Longimicrobiales bacterium]